MMLLSRPKAAVYALAFFTSMGACAFPEGASVPTKDELRQRLADRSFTVELANKTSWRLQFKANGYFFINTSTGLNGSGEWRTEDGKLCSNLQGAANACNDARVFENVLYLRRTDGELIKYMPQ